jgi:chromosome segregation ATPase
MKSSRGVQQYEVDAAADALVAERQRPTIERVRQKLGRGSPNTIAPMLEAWFGTLAPRLGVAAIDDGEGSMPAEVRDAVDVLWRSALSLAQTRAAERLQSDRSALEQERLDLAAAQATLDAANEQLAHREALLRDALADAQARAEDAKKRAQLLEIELARKDAELGQVRDSLGKSVAERDSDRRRFDAQLQAAAVEREKQQERAAATERRLLEEVDRARQESKQLRSEVAAAEKSYEGVRGELERAKRQLHQAEGENKVAVATLTEKLAAAGQRVKDLQSALNLSIPNTRPGVRKATKTVR